MALFLCQFNVFLIVFLMLFQILIFKHDKMARNNVVPALLQLIDGLTLK